VLVDHAEELESAVIGGGIELEIHGPHLVAMLGSVTPHRAVGGPSPFSLPESWPLQTFHPPEPVHPLVIDGPALSPQQAVGHAVAPTDVVRGDFVETPPELGLLDRDDLAAMALRAAVLAHPPPGGPGVQRCPATIR
jgi:hypothetical protein